MHTPTHSAHMCVRTHIYTHTHIQTHTRTHTNAHLRAQTHTRTHTYTHMEVLQIMRELRKLALLEAHEQLVHQSNVYCLLEGAHA